MPKKRTGRALLIKPGSQPSNASTSSGTPRHDESTSPSVNDLIRESRRMQLRDQSVPSTPVTTSVPPQVREVLHLPAPESPRPRPAGERGSRPLPTPIVQRGCTRRRLAPGPAAPRSWLIDSRHASEEARQARDWAQRYLEDSTPLPGAFCLTAGSLLHTTLRDLAANWPWYAEAYDSAYFAIIPTKYREVLLSYIAEYHAGPVPDPLQRLFVEANIENWDEVTFLDLSNSLSSWATVRAIDRSLVQHQTGAFRATAPTDEVPDSWETAQSISMVKEIGTSSLRFSNLAHLSLALNPTLSSASSQASWKSLLQLAKHLPALQSLSLGWWPRPTYTPVAASTRATISIDSGGSHPRTVFGGTNMYSAIDDDWRESAGILSTLSRRLPGLTWLDLTGCHGWWNALSWVAPETEDQPGAPFETSSRGPVPWNSGWRGITTVVLKIGWVPEPGPLRYPRVTATDTAALRQSKLLDKAMARLDHTKHARIRGQRHNVIERLRAMRRDVKGAWIDFVV
jgi:hypothetical protein